MLIKEIENTTPVDKGLALIKPYIQLLKVRLSLLVAFSASIGYVLGASSRINVLHFLVFVVAGFMVTASANIINQVKEIKYDKLMKRTMIRPLPTNTLTSNQAIIFSITLGIIGLGLHFFYVNGLTALISLVSLVLYGFVYTPLKRVGPIAVFVGAFPGAFPPLIGWVAATGGISIEALILFGIQFMWQFPHFWAIAWVADEDYQKAGFKLLPSKGGRNLNTAFNIMIYTLVLVPLSLMPMYIGLTGKVSAIIVTIAGILFLMQTFYLMKTCDRKAALWIMFGSFLYLPIVQIAFVADKL